MPPTIFAGMRLQTLTYVYDDESAHPERPVSAIQSPAWTPEDQALVMGLAQYESGLCRCGHPRSVAWHSEMDGWLECNPDTDQFVCHGCTARNDGKQVIYQVVRNTYDPTAKGPLPPFVLGVTTTPPSPSS